MLAAYGSALALAWIITPAPGVHDVFWCGALAALATVLYSVKPCYAKCRGWWANLTIALPRGVLLKVAGWGCVAPALTDPEPWWIGCVFGAFLLGAASTKDLADEPGDRAAGCRTLVVRHGRAAVERIIAVALAAPWAAIAVGAVVHLHGRAPLLHARFGLAAALAALLTGYGLVIGRMLRRQSRAIDANHAAWTHMYLLMVLAQGGLVAVYWC